MYISSLIQREVHVVYMYMMYTVAPTQTTRNEQNLAPSHHSEQSLRNVNSLPTLLRSFTQIRFKLHHIESLHLAVYKDRRTLQEHKCTCTTRRLSVLNYT